MTAPDLDQRRTDVRERMDDPECDPEKLRRTYRHFAVLNRLISRWNHIYSRHIRPHLSPAPGEKTSLLDIGYGGGDIARRLAEKAAREGYRLEITGIDTDRRAWNYARSLPNPHDVRFQKKTPGELIREGRQFDFVVSNHLLHHLTGPELERLAAESSALCRRKILFCDIERSVPAWHCFNLLSRPFFRDSFITEDGLRSIRRSYRRGELERALPEGWEVQRLFPFRLLALKEEGTEHG